MDKRAILLLNYISVASASSAVITPAMPRLEKFFTLSNGQVELVVSLFLLGYMMGQLIYGPVANRFGRVAALRSGLILNLVGILICISSYFSDMYSILLFGRFITALGAASGLICTFILINETYEPEQAKRIFNFTPLSFSAGLSLSILLGGLITEYFGWVYCFVLLLIHGSFLLFATRYLFETLVVEKIKPIQIKPLLSSYIENLKCFKLYGFSFILSATTVAAYAISAAAPIVSHNVLKLSPAEFGTWNLVNTVGMIIGGFTTPLIARRLTTTSMILMGVVLFYMSCISLYIFSLSQSVSILWFFSSTAVMYICLGLIYPNASYLASNAIEDRAIASGLMNFINLGNPVLAVTIMGYLPVSALNAFTSIVFIFVIFSSFFYWRLQKIEN